MTKTTTRPGCFKPYLAKSSIRYAYEIKGTDFILPSDKSTSETIGSISCLVEQDVHFSHQVHFKAGDFIIYNGNDDLYHCDRTLFLRLYQLLGNVKFDPTKGKELCPECERLAAMADIYLLNPHYHPMRMTSYCPKHSDEATGHYVDDLPKREVNEKAAICNARLWVESASMALDSGDNAGAVASLKFADGWLERLS